MNASALLTSQGWLGPGHALDTRLTDYGAQTYKQKGHRGLAYDPSTQTQTTTASTTLQTGNGLIRPLLISQRHGSTRGIGKKAHEPASGNEWWLKGFASALANVGKSEDERSSAVSSGTSTPRNGNNGYFGKHSGLYTYFTSGAVMKGTIDAEEQEVQSGQKDGKSKKRKSDVLEEEEEEGRDPLAVSPVKRPQTAKDLESSIPYLTERDKSRKKSHKHAKSSDVDTFTMIGSFLGAVQPPSAESPQNGVQGEEREETKEERAARRKRRKEDSEKKERKKGAALTLAQMVEEEMAKLSSMDDKSEDDEDAGEDLQKARRKKRKEREKARVKMEG